MTYEEALCRVKGYLTDIIPAEDYSEVEEIIKALEQQPCEDAIRREDALNGVDAMYNNSWDLRDFRQNVDLMLKELPPVTPQQKYGEWIVGRYKDTCSQCRCTYPKDIGFKNYCPNCGTEMQEVEDGNK